jgi:hypothetical protein
VPSSGANIDNDPIEDADPPEVPRWAIRYADAAIRSGLGTPEIEANLVRKGLSIPTAEITVSRCLELRIRGVEGRTRQGLSWIRMNRLASGLVATGYLVALWSAGAPASLVWLSVGLLVVPVTVIWLCAPLARYNRWSWSWSSRTVYQRVHPVFMAIVGWALLLGPALVIIAVTLSRSR